MANNRDCKVEPRCNSGSKERDKLPESFVQFPGRNTKQMDYVKEVEEWDKQTKRGGWCEGNRAKTSIQKNALEQQRGSSLRMVEQPSEGEGRAGREGAGEMDESCWGLKGASERVNLK